MTSEAWPRVSVIVPTFRRPRQLADCLEALARQDYPMDRLEVIVVDDGSGAPPRQVVDGLSSRLPVALYERGNGGPGAARNTGAAHATGTILCFIDDDCVPEPAWVRELVLGLSSHPDAAVGGKVVNGLPENRYSEASQLLTTWLYEYFQRPDKRHRQFFTANNLAVRAERFHALGGFDTESLADTAEDRDFCDRWRTRGWPLVYWPAAVVRHAHGLTLRSFAGQHHHYGRGAIYFHRAPGRIESLARKPEPIEFYLGLLAYPFRHGPGHGTLTLALLLVLSQLAYVAGYVRERLHPRKPPVRPDHTGSTRLAS